MLDRESSSDEWLAAPSGADDDGCEPNDDRDCGLRNGGGSAALEGALLARRRELWNYTATVHFGDGIAAARPARGMVVAADVCEARERARTAAERMFRAYGRAMAVIVTRLW
jgi:hypothetical protein